MKSSLISGPVQAIYRLGNLCGATISVRCFRDAFYFCARAGPPEGIISDAGIVSQFPCLAPAEPCCLVGLIKDPTFVTEVVVVVRTRPILFPSLRQKDFERAPPVPYGRRRVARIALRNPKNLFFADRAHALLFG